MMNSEFEKVVSEFQKGDTEKKIELYVSTEDLTQDQYKQLLKFFPMNELHKLEEALQ